MGLIHMAQQGRNGDSTVAHMTPGEMVVPREVAAMRPDLVAHIQDSIASFGVDPSRYVVGGNRARRNPATGAQEFATADEINAAYQTNFGRDASDADQAYWGTGDNFANGFAGAAAAEKAQDPSTGLTAESRSTYDQIYGNNSAAPVPPAMAATSAAPPASAATPATAATSTPAPAPAPPAPTNVANWYRNDLGRDGEQAGIDYWNGQLKNSGRTADQVYGDFQAAAGASQEAPANLGLADANAAYKGFTSAIGNSTVDDWARNEFGRGATADELARYGNATTPGQAQANYTAFMANAGQPGKNLGLVGASQLKPAAANAPINLTYQPNLNQDVSADATIEGRLNNVLAQDANGNYTNDVVRQAVERAQQQFASRGLFNTSMAAQAGQEAAIAKAIDIVGPDAQRFFDQSRANQDAQNTFANNEVNQVYTQSNAAQAQQYTQANNNAQFAHDDSTLAQQQGFNLQQNYITAADRVNDRYASQVNQINASNMTPEARAVAVQQASAARDGDLANVNDMFAHQPLWQSQWQLTPAVATGSLDISAVTDYDTLYNIVNDPAQSAAVVKLAKDRLATLGQQTADKAAADKQAADTSYKGMIYQADSA